MIPYVKLYNLISTGYKQYYNLSKFRGLGTLVTGTQKWKVQILEESKVCTKWFHKKFNRQNLMVEILRLLSFTSVYCHPWMARVMRKTPGGNIFLFTWFWLSRSWHRVSCYNRGYYNSGFNSHLYCSGQLTRMVGQSGLMLGHYLGLPGSGYATGYKGEMWLVLGWATKPIPLLPDALIYF